VLVLSFLVFGFVAGDSTLAFSLIWPSFGIRELPLVLYLLASSVSVGR
jgi:hypothetical protein